VKAKYSRNIFPQAAGRIMTPSMTDQSELRKLLRDHAGNPILEQYSEEGFIDCVLKITDLSKSKDFFSFHLSASSDGQALGFDVAVRTDIRHGLDADVKIIREHVSYHGVQFFRSGPASDALIQRLAKLYGLSLPNLTMVSKETYTAIALHKHPFDLHTDPVRLKIFGKDGEPVDEESYNESFFNLDLSQGLVFWNEKDPDYRNALIRGLSAPTEA
jgi:hypothetical protein